MKPKLTSPVLKNLLDKVYLVIFHKHFPVVMADETSSKFPFICKKILHDKTFNIFAKRFIIVV